jgi:hypothetical protein
MISGARSLNREGPRMADNATRLPNQSPRRWYPLRDAARMLCVSPAALRKLLERRVRRAVDGGTEAIVDGVHGRKFGNRWRVSFDKAWTE